LAATKGLFTTRKVIMAIIIIAIILIGIYVALTFYYRPSNVGTEETDYASKFLTNRQQLAEWLLSKYNSTYQLIQGSDIGRCGYQPNAFDLIPTNFFASKVLEPYNATVSNLIRNATNNYLGKFGYQHDDRREVLFGNAIPYPPDKSQKLNISGSPPPSDCSLMTSFWIVTEWPNSTSPYTSYSSVGTIVTALLEKYREGDLSTARSLFNIALGWWHSDSSYNGGFLTPGAQKAGNFLTRDICYFLFAQRATRFAISSTILNQVETRLWSLQNSSLNNGLSVAYNFDGTSGATHSSANINSLCLLAFDARIQSTWWPSSRSTQSTSSVIPSSGLFMVVAITEGKKD